MLDHHDHDHQKCHDDALRRAEARCQAEGLRLTAQRRQVLDIMLESHAPITAYEIIDRIAAVARRPSPISVYRALDFLVANHFVHRIESRNAFLACSHDHGPASADREPVLMFLLCEACGAAIEAEPPALTSLISDVSAAAGFTVTSSVLEIRGLCASCRTAGRHAPHATPHADDHEDHP
ncbi:Fur family transcriptional regulator [Oryzibacter oryziterrae]|uniref:Fur family transcriptional regulator n=1 Tax=Oryzibacter oryziterrae TaxID=2766474 RepID=UPI0028BD9A52|nr:Fur family transcriptional regulator [Oryzibacter oryziterrae]